MQNGLRLVQQQGVRVQYITVVGRGQKRMQLVSDCGDNCNITNEASRHIVALAVSASVQAGL